MISIYLSYRSADFRKELYYRKLQDVKEGDSWRVELAKWVRIQKKCSDHDYIRVAVIDESQLQIVAYVDMANREIVFEQIPEQEDLFN